MRHLARHNAHIYDYHLTNHGWLIIVAIEIAATVMLVILWFASAIAITKWEYKSECARSIMVDVR